MNRRQVFLVVSNSGDGANSVEWFHDCTKQQLYDYLNTVSDSDRYQSGDGVQIWSYELEGNLPTNMYLMTIEQHKEDYCGDIDTPPYD